MKRAVLISLFFISSLSIGQHSIGMEIGYNFLGGSFFHGESGSFYAISYEYNWDKNTSFIIKPSFSQNRDFFIGTSDDGVSALRRIFEADNTHMPAFFRLESK